MTAKSSNTKKPAEQVVKDIRRATRRHFSAEDKIRIVLDGLRCEDSTAELCRRKGIAQSLYYTWSKEFMEAGPRRLAGDRRGPPASMRSRICAARPARWRNTSLT
jgi:transposase